MGTFARETLANPFGAAPRWPARKYGSVTPKSLSDRLFIRNLRESSRTEMEGIRNGMTIANQGLDEINERCSKMNQPLDSRQLRAFVALAQTGSFTQTAKTLFLSQSAISHSIKALEGDVGCRLLDRVGKESCSPKQASSCSITRERFCGDGVCAHILQHLGKWGKGRLRLGASSTACQYILPVSCGSSKRDSLIAIFQSPSDSEECVELLQHNRIDLAVALQPKHEVPLEFPGLFTRTNWHS